MPITVTCPCGKAYQKPDHKEGTLFRCHLCGREVEIAGPAGDGIVAFAPGDAPPAREESDLGREVEARATAAPPRSPRHAVSQNLVAWTLIVLGLAGVLGGAAMFYMFSVIGRTEDEIARARANSDPFLMAPVQQDPNRGIKRYGSATVSVVVGGVLLLWGFGTRHKLAVGCPTFKTGSASPSPLDPRLRDRVKTRHPTWRASPFVAREGSVTHTPTGMVHGARASRGGGRRRSPSSSPWSSRRISCGSAIFRCAGRSRRARKSASRCSRPANGSCPICRVTCSAVRRCKTG